MAIDAPAAHDIESAGGDRRVEEREITRVVLAVAVHREDKLAAGGVEAGKEGGGLTAVLRVANGAELRPAGGGGANFVGRGVGAAVVNEDDFEIAGEGSKDGHGGFEEREDVAGFVVERDDE